MKPHDLKAHKAATKLLKGLPVFSNKSKVKLPKPLHRAKGARIHRTDLLTLSDTHRACMLWRDGETLEDTAFYGYLFCTLGSGALYPLLEFHWHASHKGYHCMVPCNTDMDYTNRLLPKAPELAISGRAADPRTDDGLRQLVLLFCKCCGITIDTAQEGQMSLPAL